MIITKKMQLTSYLLLLLFSFNAFSNDKKNFSLEHLIEFESKKKVELDNNKNVFVLFWATWCTTCKVKITEVIPKLRKKYKNTTFLALNIDKDLGRVRHYIDKNEIKEEVVIDPKGILTKNLNNNIAPYWAVLKFNEKNNQWALIKSQSGFEQSIFTKLLKK